MQEPFLQWEKEWYYGMIICGDPTLYVSQTGEPVLSIDIVSPSNGIYLSNQKLFPFSVPVVFGDAKISVDIINSGYGIDEISFSVNGEHLFVDTDPPYIFTYNVSTFGKIIIAAMATDFSGDSVTKILELWKFF